MPESRFLCVADFHALRFRRIVKDTKKFGRQITNLKRKQRAVGKLNLVKLAVGSCF
jgi:hypothetical protein